MLRLETGVSRDHHNVSERIQRKRVESIAREKDKYTNNLISQNKLILALDLDHTLLHATRLRDMKHKEKNKIDFLEQDVLKGELFKLDKIGKAAKLRPFVRDFLEEASKLFVMYIHTKASRPYAREIVRLLDPKGIYFEPHRVIAQEDSTDITKKDLDLVLGQESAILIVDDTERVWRDHKENLILVDKYNFFSSSTIREFDGHENDSALVSILEVLKETHSRFFNGPEDEIMKRDVRKVLGAIRKGVLEGCKVVFSEILPNKSVLRDEPLWKNIAEQLGAMCSDEVDSSVTHVISNNPESNEARWAVKEGKFVVTYKWLEFANYFWKRKPEEDYLTTRPISDKGFECLKFVFRCFGYKLGLNSM